MRRTIRRFMWGFSIALMISVWLAYRATSPFPSGDASGCLWAFFILSEGILIGTGACLLSCGGSEEPLDPACLWRCWRRFLILEGILITLVLACLAATAPW